MTEPSPLELHLYQEQMVTSRYPAWWHRWGGTLRLVRAGRDGIALLASHASLQIHWDHPQFLLAYEIRDLSDPYVERTITVKPEILGLMFDIDQRPVDEKLYGGQHRAADCVRDCYIRSGRFLNIPGPGDGRDGNPNLSVYVFDGIRQAIADLVHAAL